MARFLGRFGWSRRDESDLDEEMRLHLDLEVERLVDAGLDPAAARRQARRRFGNLALAAEDSREVWGLPPVDTWLRDVAIALRSFRRSPLLSVVAVSTLALGLGATGSAFVLLDSLVLRPLPVERPDELVLLRWTAPEFPAASLSGWVDRDESGTQWVSSALPEPGVRALAASRTLAALAAFAELDGLNVAVAGEAERHTAQAVSGGYFRMLGVDSQAGRLLSASDDRPGSAAAVVLDHAYWQSRFAGDRRVVGRTLRINGHPFTVVGVAEAGFSGTLQAGTRPALYLPIAAQPLVGAGTDNLGDDGVWWLHVLGRRRPGVSLPAVDAEVRSLFAGYLAAVPPPAGEERVPVRLAAEPGAHGLVEARRTLLRPLLLLQALLALVLVIACANVGNLLLARAVARRHEMATRLSLGAARPRLVRQLLTESVTLTLAGGATGAALLLWLPPVLAATLPQLAGASVPAGGLPASRGVAVVLATAVVCGLVLGLVPALRATRTGLGPLLGERGPAPRSGRIGRGLVVAQIGLSLLVVAAAALLGRSLWNLERADVGFQSEGILLLEVDAATAGYEGERRLRLYDRALDDLRTLAGARAVALSRHALLGGRAAVSPLYHFGDDGPATPSPGPIWRLPVSDGFFATLEIPLVGGRGFAPSDAPGAKRVAIVNREAVRRFFGGASPLGREVTFSDADAQPTEIVGVAGDTFYDQARNGVPPMVFTPWRQEVDALRTATFALAADGPPLALERPARAALARIDADLPVFAVRTQRQQIDEALLESRRLAQVAALFALLALLLASIGVYGVTAYGVVQRRPEIGIRVALGSGRRRVLWLVLREVAVALAFGVVAGVVAATLASRFLADRLYGVSPTDPSTIAVGAVLLALVALAAAALTGCGGRASASPDHGGTVVLDVRYSKFSLD
ncbi:MAG TPA: ADOP family duplicated permease, partial [Thermoanaerobaculia bacterium]|nr:ADOP family duplicated permease [Thermoanaerobaculia bacterium]